jgi:transposase-like protein
VESSMGYERPRAEAVADLVERVRRDGRRQYRPEAKRSLLQQCARPGMSIAAVALANGLNANVLRRWILQDQRAVAGVVKPAAATMLPVVVREAVDSAAASRSAADAGAPIEIEIGSARIRLLSHATVEQIGAVVSALRA